MAKEALTMKILDDEMMLTLASKIGDAIRTKNPERIQKLIQVGAPLKMARFEGHVYLSHQTQYLEGVGMCVLGLASSLGHEEELKLLIKSGCTPGRASDDIVKIGKIDPKAKLFLNPLEWSAVNGHLTCAALLLDHFSFERDELLLAAKMAMGLGHTYVSDQKENVADLILTRLAVRDEKKELTLFLNHISPPNLDPKANAIIL